MASIHRKPEHPAKLRPFGRPSSVVLTGETIWRSTKQTDHRTAIAVARKWGKSRALGG